MQIFFVFRCSASKLTVPFKLLEHCLSRLSLKIFYEDVRRNCRNKIEIPLSGPAALPHKIPFDTLCKIRAYPFLNFNCLRTKLTLFSNSTVHFSEIYGLRPRQPKNKRYSIDAYYGWILYKLYSSP